MALLRFWLVLGFIVFERLLCPRHTDAHDLYADASGEAGGHGVYSGCVLCSHIERDAGHIEEMLHLQCVAQAPDGEKADELAVFSVAIGGGSASAAFVSR